MKVGIDFDGTINAYPEVLGMLVDIIGPANCFLVTARPRRAEMETLAEASKIGFPLERLGGAFYYPGSYDYAELDSTPGLWDKLIDFKVQSCKEAGIDIMVEDDPRYKEALEAAGVHVLLLE